jgi:hypothetical protein
MPGAPTKASSTGKPGVSDPVPERDVRRAGAAHMERVYSGAAHLYRARGLGGCWTTGNLVHEKEAARVLGIPYGDVMQAEGSDIVLNVFNSRRKLPP